jgi:acetyltransferase-like isoleucine patch superfamily enzyme
MSDTKPADLFTFNEADYLEANPDVAKAVTAGIWKSGAAHYTAQGCREGRKLARAPSSVAYESSGEIVFRLTPAVCQALSEMNVFMGYREVQPPDPNRTVKIPKSAVFEEYTSFQGTFGTMGAFSYSENLITLASVGRYCSIAERLTTYGERHPLEYVTSSGFTYSRAKPQFTRFHREILSGEFPPEAPIARALPIVEHDVWIGQSVILARNITLGTGCIVGAGSNVTKSVAPYTIVGGNPARIIRPRFPEDIAERLLKTRWWEYHPRLLLEMDFRNPSDFCSQFEDAIAAEALGPATFKRWTWRDIMERLNRPLAG